MPAMDVIPSPYNFVPLSDQVFTWEDSGNLQDLPFSDGLSGVVRFEILTRTPVYVRAAGVHAEERRDRFSDPNYRAFYRLPDDTVALPGTSLKGMVRSALEIASFGKMSRVDRSKIYSFREINHPGYRGQFVSRHQPVEQLTKTGWVEQRADGSWWLTPCESARIEQEELEKLFSLRAWSLSKEQSAAEKYCALGGGKYDKAKLRINFDRERNHFRTTFTGGRRTQLSMDLAWPSAAANTLEGVVVVTGQPSNKKHLDFVFYGERPADEFCVTEQVASQFREVHSGTGTPSEPSDYDGLWRDQLEKRERMPVFYLEAAGKVHSLGLAMLYRLPCDNAVQRAINNVSPDHLRGDQTDLAELIFGRVEAGRPALKGRAAFLPAVLRNEAETVAEDVVTVLGAPRPTFYPNYLQQPYSPNAPGKLAVERPYKTFMDHDGKVRGWKRYPASLKTRPVNPVPLNRNPAGGTEPNQDVATAFRPLKEGRQFAGELHFHNLRPFELGAVLWSMTFGSLDGPESPHWHRIGMGKPFGFGALTIRVQDGEMQSAGPDKVPGLSACLDAFVTEMNQRSADAFGEPWLETEQLRQLLAMADPQQAWPEPEMRYPRLNPTQREDEFREHKGRDRRHVLRPHVPLQSHPVRPTQKKGVPPASSGRLVESAPLTSPAPRAQAEPPVGGVSITPGQTLPGEVLKCSVKGKWRVHLTGSLDADDGWIEEAIPDPIQPNLRGEFLVLYGSRTQWRLRWLRERLV